MNEIESQRYEVVANHEGQYSIWPTSREIPSGWKKAEFGGTREQRLDYIRGVWTDMRPLSVRQAMVGEAGA
ncbi:MbtH family protein [Burkholderia multivorans]|uniref:MbtH family protein n=1 Tax=Burkholderia multivorans TaxID=87883 RepID=UPI000F50C50C|nr:MbtH family NRPS accessory protein [Burkholderia multivorans]AYY59632.1 MbtH family protein [Burkholderia multivorans]MCA8441046.1 MbtH family NRPS accessory protein [Burkholderia multivorans]